MLLTAPPLAAAALAAADRSWVRQVISFGDAPGAIGFGALLQAGALRRPRAAPGDPALLPYARTPGGVLTPEPVSHQDMSAMLLRLAADAEIGEKDVVLAAPPRRRPLLHRPARPRAAAPARPSSRRGPTNWPRRPTSTTAPP